MALPRGAEHILQKLLDLVDVCFDLAVEGDEGRVRPWGQIVKICRFSTTDTTIIMNSGSQPWYFHVIALLTS